MIIFNGGRGRLAGWLLALTIGIGAGPVQALTLKIATVSPDGSVWMNALREAAAQVDARTEGRVKIKYYPGGVMGDDKAVLKKMRVGQLHGAVLTTGVLAQVYPDIQVYGLAMVFRDNEEVDAVRAQLDDQLLAGLEEAGYVAFGLAEVGFAYGMTQEPTTSVAAMQSRKVWVPDGDLASARALQAFGINPIPLGIADVLGGLQTGLINTVAAPPVGAIALQWHTRLSHVLDLPLLYTYGLIAVSERQFRKISAADQAVVRELMGEAVAAVNARSRTDHERAVEALRVQGLTWLQPSATELAEWQAYADRANAALVDEGFVSREIWDALQAQLQNLR